MYISVSYRYPIPISPQVGNGDGGRVFWVGGNGVACDGVGVVRLVAVALFQWW